MNDCRSFLAKERDKWFESQEGKNCCEGTTEGEYLKNRLEIAFLNGAKVYEDYYKRALEILASFGILEAHRDKVDAWQYLSQRNECMKDLSEFMKEIIAKEVR